MLSSTFSIILWCQGYCCESEITLFKLHWQKLECSKKPLTHLYSCEIMCNLLIFMITTYLSELKTCEKEYIENNTLKIGLINDYI